jgi:hypothetical protein
MADNSKIKKAALVEVIAYERLAGRRASVASGSGLGFDLISTQGGSVVRHILVKGTLKLKFTERWLEQSQQDALTKDKKFWLYLVTRAGSKNASVSAYDRAGLTPRFLRAETKYLYRF